MVVFPNLDQDIEPFQKGRISYRNVKDYKTKNVNRILEIEKPDLIVVANNSIIEMALMLAGKSKFIPSLVVDHAAFPRACHRKPRVIKETIRRLTFQKIVNQLPYFICSGLTLHLMRILKQSIATGYDSGLEYATRICVTNDNLKAALANQGVDLDKIVVTGQPRFDALLASKGKDNKEQIYSRFGLPSQRKLALLLTEAFVEDSLWTAKQREIFVSKVLTAIQATPECVPVVKIHPRESIEGYRGLLEQLSLHAVPIAQSEVPLYDLLHASDLVIGVASTTLLEAMVFDKPVIVANLFKEPDRFGFIASGAALCTERPEDLAPAIQSALHDEKVRAKLAGAREKFVYDHAYIQDGQASRRVANLIIQMIEESRKAKGKT